ncbi:MAG: repeat protein, partial [Myxococcaceae bacterium]|nr:repeat protein [Myxococcaceae bacterium]
DDEEEEEDDDVPAPAAAAAPARKAAGAPGKVAPKAAAPATTQGGAKSTAPRRGLALPIAAIVASIAIVYVATMRKDEPTKPASSEPAASADGLLDQAEHALDEGDTKLATERVGQAEAMTKSPRALLDHARIDAAIADTSWLHARLIATPGAPPAAVPAANAARTSAEAAMAAAPNDPAAARAKLDALRIAGDLEGARALVPRLAAIGEQSETAYVSAALELAEEGPVSLGAIARLRESVASGHQSTRARAALAYALARSGDLAGARHEIDALAAKSSGAPVIGELRAFVARADHGAKPAVSVVPPVASSVAIVAPTTPPVVASVAPPVTSSATAKPATSATTAPATTEKAGPASMAAALEAQKSGDLARANTLFKALVAKNPNDIESLTALGDISRKEGRTRDAIGFYRRALVVNTSFFPALLGLADALWDSGERAAAQQRYTEITSRFSPGMYPTYVRQRIAADAGAP